MLAGLIATGRAIHSPFSWWRVSGTRWDRWSIGRSARASRIGATGSWFPLTPAQYETASRYFTRYGLWSLLFAWLPFVGDPLTVVAGVLRVPLARFIVLVAIGKAARYAAVMAGVSWLSGS